MTQEKVKNNVGPFLTMVFLFFIVGFLTTANTQFQGPLKNAFLSGAGALQNTLTTLITFSWFLAYPIFGSVGSSFVHHSGYKGTLVRGLALMITGILLMDASAWVNELWPDAFVTMAGCSVHVGFFVFLLGSFVIGGSATVLQVVINPYLVACEVKGTQPVQRLAMGGTGNSVGTTVAPYFVSGIVFGGVSMSEVSVDQIIIPFLALGAVLLVVLLTVLQLKLPNLQNTCAAEGEKLERSVWSFRHLTLGVVAISCYVGCEVCIGGNINLYVMNIRGESAASTATLMATLYWGGLMVGRIAASFLSKIPPRSQLTCATLTATLLVVVAMITNNPWLLVVVGLCHSIMWGCIYTLAVTHLGKYTVAASGVFMIGVVGGAILPLLQGMLADVMDGWRWTWTLVIVGELIMLSYSLLGSRIRPKDIAD